MAAEIDSEKSYAGEPLVERCVRPSDADFQQIRQIYEANFPAPERKSFELIRSQVICKKYECFLCRDSTQDVVAFALLAALPQTDAVFLEYLAVDERVQSRGLGTRLLRQVFEDLQQINSKIIWEIEPPLQSDGDNPQNRRLRFYLRLGAEVIALSAVYAMPDFSNSSHSRVPLRLMQFPRGQQPTRDEIATLVRGIYEVAYPEWTWLREEILKDLSLPITT